MPHSSRSPHWRGSRSTSTCRFVRTRFKRGREVAKARGMTSRADIQPIPLSLVDSDPAQAADRLGDSFRRTGFAVIEGHGIPEQLIAQAWDAARAFFALPEDVKRRYHVAGGAGQRGYTPFGIETAKGATLSDLKEFWHVARDLPTGHRHAGIMA